MPLHAGATGRVGTQPDEPESSESSVDASVDLDGATAKSSMAPSDVQDEPAPARSNEEQEPWITRNAPEGGMTELGVFGGLFVLNKSNELFEANKNLPFQGAKPMRELNGEFGLRVGVYPLSFFGIEAEGAFIPSKTNTTDEPKRAANIWSGRGHLVLQFPRSIAPFVVVGAGALGVSSAADAVGKDIDFAIHFGGGVKFFVTPKFAIRLDVRDVISMKRDGYDVTGIKSGDPSQLGANNLEALLGLSLTLGRKDAPPPPPPPPAAPKDTDGDGYIDPEDQCPLEPETFNEFQDEDGCPESDRDGDKFWDNPDQDKCPDEPGVEPDGCPIRDTDGDGFMDPDDKCVNEPETKNGYEDDDGCPDEIPEEVARFMGVIEGIHFEFNKDVIKPDSAVVLNRAIEILRKFPSIRIEISGHTDNKGSAAYNMDLSTRRAAAVKTYLGERGIDASRMESRGAGFDEPIADNATSAGRAQNRRIEFKILTQ
jgi:outer membrane protein OmpA-like peptidoglycan-associated protein